MRAKKKIGKQFASSVGSLARSMKEPKGYAVPLDPDVVAKLKQWSEASSIPVVRLVNRILRDSMNKEASPAFVSAVADIVEKIDNSFSRAAAIDKKLNSPSK
jgi:hypothetical protein